MIRRRPRAFCSDEALVQLFRSAYASEPRTSNNIEPTMTEGTERTWQPYPKLRHVGRRIVLRIAIATAGIVALAAVTAWLIVMVMTSDKSLLATEPGHSELGPVAGLPSPGRYAALSHAINLTHMSATTPKTGKPMRRQPVTIGHHVYQNGLVLNLDAGHSQASVNLSYHLDRHGITSNFQAILDVPEAIDVAAKCQFSLFTENGLLVQSLPPVSSSKPLPVDISIGDADQVTVRVRAIGSATSVGCALADPMVLPKLGGITSAPIGTAGTQPVAFPHLPPQPRSPAAGQRPPLPSGIAKTRGFHANATPPGGMP
jgi:hypothetical protein